MGTSTITRYRTNGVLSTGDTVFSNLEKLTRAAGAWLTYDQHAGKWSVVINRAGTSRRTFDDSNIVGPITLSGTGILDLYNGVRASFPHQDLRDQTDYVEITVPAGDRFPNEPDNILEISYPVVTNPVQAELLAFIELKQSRVDQIIQFATDYSNIDLRAGDIITVNNPVFGLVNQLYRIITITESDAESGELTLQITAQQYSADVYDESNLNRYPRTDSNGIRGIGTIDEPSTPEVTKIEVDSRPRVQIETVVATGLADAVEFWYTRDVETPDDSNRAYQLLGTVTPVNSTTFEPGESVIFTADNLSASNFYVKCRAKNGRLTSAFSGVSGLVEYVPVQTTDNISDDTTWDGNLGQLGLAAMLALLSSFLGDGSKAMSKLVQDSARPRTTTQYGIAPGAFTDNSGVVRNVIYTAVDNIYTGSGLGNLGVWGVSGSVSGTSQNPISVYYSSCVLNPSIGNIANQNWSDWQWIGVAGDLDNTFTPTVESKSGGFGIDGGFLFDEPLTAFIIGYSNTINPPNSAASSTYTRPWTSGTAIYDDNTGTWEFSGLSVSNPASQLIADGYQGVVGFTGQMRLQ